MPKTKEELEKEQQEAKEKLDALLNQSKPKNLRQGVGNGVNNILAGAIGGAGVAVLAPTMGLAVGLRGGGIIGGVVGVAGGAVIGVIGGAALIVGGAVSGVTQIFRGVAAVPAAVTAPRQGKWWNDATHSWVLTDLSKADVPDNDDDLLKKLEDDLDAAGAPSGANTGAVKETFYYDALEVDPKAEPSAIKRRYYVLARKYHPDKVAADDKESADKFKEVAEAYQVLSDPKLREKYDKDGREGLSGDKTEVNEDRNADPAILMAFLFGSDKFNDYIGRLATSTSAMLGDSPNISAVDARTLQERRCTRLAKKLAEKIDPWVKEDYDMCKALWQTEATTLSMASHGWELVKTIGMVSSFLIDSLFHSNMFQKSCRLFSAD
jgi:DnaJ-domain-containing protein 1